jgi:hypothetical protein
VRIRFIRRARFGADGFDLHEVPLGEDREEYQLDVMAGATLKRRVNLTEPEFFYSGPDELADFGASQSSLSLVITQVSPVIGAGTSLTTTISIA